MNVRSKVRKNEFIDCVKVKALLVTIKRDLEKRCYDVTPFKFLIEGPPTAFKCSVAETFLKDLDTSSL